MSATGKVLRQLHAGEIRLAATLLDLAARQEEEPEIRHVALDLAQWSRGNAERLAALGPERGFDPSTETPYGGARVEPAAAFTAASAILAHLRTVHLMAADNLLLWEMLGQVAQAQRDGELLDASSKGHPQTLRQMRWSNTQIKTLSPQLLSAPD